VIDFGLKVFSKDLIISVDGVEKAVYILTRIICNDGKDLFVLTSLN